MYGFIGIYLPGLRAGSWLRGSQVLGAGGGCLPAQGRGCSGQPCRAAQPCCPGAARDMRKMFPLNMAVQGRKPPPRVAPPREQVPAVLSLCTHGWRLTPWDVLWGTAQGTAPTAPQRGSACLWDTAAVSPSWDALQVHPRRTAAPWGWTMRGAQPQNLQAGVPGQLLQLCVGCARCCCVSPAGLTALTPRQASNGDTSQAGQQQDQS